MSFISNTREYSTPLLFGFISKLIAFKSIADEIEILYLLWHQKEKPPWCSSFFLRVLTFFRSNIESHFICKDSLF